MKAHTLTGEQAYNWGKHFDLYQKSVCGKTYELITFDSYGQDGFIIARNERDTVILRESRTYTFYTKVK